MGDYGPPTISSMMAGECDESYDAEDRHRQLREAARRNQVGQVRELPRKNHMVHPEQQRCMASWHERLGHFVQPMRSSRGETKFACLSVAVGCSKYWNNRMVCEYCHNFGRSVHRMREAFVPVTRVLMSFMKDPAKAKEVKDRITQLYLRVAGRRVTMQKVTSQMKLIVDKYYPQQHYLEKALQVVKNHQRQKMQIEKAQLAKTQSQAKSKAAKRQPAVSKRRAPTKPKPPKLPPGFPSKPYDRVNQYFPKTALARKKIKEKEAKSGKLNQKDKAKFLVQAWRTLPKNEKDKVTKDFKKKKDDFKRKLEVYKKSHKKEYEKYTKALVKYKEQEKAFKKKSAAANTIKTSKAISTNNAKNKKKPAVRAHQKKIRKIPN